MSTEPNGRVDPAGGDPRGNFTPRDGNALGSQAAADAAADVPGTDVLAAGDRELAGRLRGLRAQMPRRGVGSAFPGVVRARARRHRSRARVAAVGALVLAVVAGVGLPLGRLTSGSQPSSAAGAGPAVPYQYGGVTVTWLPAGMTHRADWDGGPLQDTSIADVGVPLIGSVVTLADPGDGAFVSTFVAPPPAALSTVWVTVIWQPQLARVPSTELLLAYLRRAPGHVTNPDVEATTVGGQSAMFASGQVNPATSPSRQDPSQRYGGLLTWFTRSGVRLVVEAAGATPVDADLLRRIGAGLVVGERPLSLASPSPSPSPTKAADSAPPT